MEGNILALANEMEEHRHDAEVSQGNGGIGERLEPDDASLPKAVRKERAEKKERMRSVMMATKAWLSRMTCGRRGRCP